MSALKKQALSSETPHCIWVEAGVVSYKLCDKDFECDNCPFDIALRQHHPTRGQELQDPLSVKVDVLPGGVTGESPREYFERLLEAFFGILVSISLPDDRLYHSGHTWVRDVGRGQSIIGIDHVGARILGIMLSIVLPPPQLRVVPNSPFTWLIHREGAISVISPISGMIVERNASLGGHPEMLYMEPYDHGWLARIQSEDSVPVTHHLQAADVYRDRLAKKFDYLRNEFLDHFKHCQSTGPTLYDGGGPIRSVADVLGSKDYFRIVKKIFSR